MPQRKEKPEKRKYVLFESAVFLNHETPEGVEIEKIYGSKELVEINDNIINAFTANQRYFNDIPVCDVKFIERDSDGELETASWHVQCTLDQATRNIELVYKTLCKLLGDTPTSDKIEL